jgi:hypothetical protein
MLQKEQLKVYNTCKENEDKGVTYDLSQVWRVSNNINGLILELCQESTWHVNIQVFSARNPHCHKTD